MHITDKEDTMSNIDEITHIESVRLSDDGKSVVIIDQTQLPNRTEYLTLSTAQDIWEAIYHLKVRGAPAIGICAGYGIYCLALQIRAEDYDGFLRGFRKYKADGCELELGAEPDETGRNREPWERDTGDT